MSAEEMGIALRRRFPKAAAELEKDLADCEAVVADDKLPPKKALALVQALSRHGAALEATAHTQAARR